MKELERSSRRRVLRVKSSFYIWYSKTGITRNRRARQKFDYRKGRVNQSGVACAFKQKQGEKISKKNVKKHAFYDIYIYI